MQNVEGGERMWEKQKQKENLTKWLMMVHDGQWWLNDA